MSRPEKSFVLLVDDNEATGTLVTAILHRDFNVEIATDGLEAIDRLKTGNYEVILLDLRMPQLDGYGVLDFIRAQRAELLGRTIVLTAALGDRELQRVKEFDVFGVIAKPFDVETLLAAVRSCAGGGGNPLGTILSSGMILLIADFLRQRWL
jgi:CheY-like chemotaxis protein